MIKKDTSNKPTTSTAEQGNLISLNLDTPVTCPECSHTFALRDGLGNATITQLRARQAEYATAREEEWKARIEREAAAAAEKAARELNQRHAAEKRRIEQQLGAVRAENADLLKQQESLSKEQQALAKERRTLAADRSKLELELSRKLEAAEEAARKERERLEKSHASKLREAAEHNRKIGREQAKAEETEALSQLTAELQAARKQANQQTKLLQQAELAKLETEEKLQSQEHAMKVALRKESNRLRKELEAEYSRNGQTLLAEAVESERSKAALKLKAAEVEKNQLLTKVEQLHRQLEQKSQQVQGEALETLLETRLADLCPEDAVEAIKTGANGADVLHSVHDEKGAHVGNISWEYKDCKKWSSAWLTKLAQDARDCGSDAAVLVSTVLPKDMDGKVAHIEGCWVCSVDAWEGLALLLRAQVIKMARLQKGLEDRDSKAAKVYAYLQSDEYLSAATTMLNTLTDMQNQVGREERAFAKQWKQRREQLKRMISLQMEQTHTIETITEQDILGDEFFAEDSAA